MDSSFSMDKARIHCQTREVHSNTHKIIYRSALADAVMEFSGKPDPANPKSSTTAALSAAACLKNLYSPISFW